jgi:hypothetical protein
VGRVKLFCFVQFVHPAGQGFDDAEATAEILKRGVRKALGCPVRRKPEWLKTDAVILKRDSIAVIGVLLYHLTVIACDLSDDRHAELLLFEFEGKP